MQVVTVDGGVPIRVWATDADEKTMAQAEHLAKLPFAAGPVALMPDAHVGFGMPIGGVLATQGVVIPHAVGVDIGCGMLACKTGIEAAAVTTDDLKVLLAEIRKRVPVGFSHHAAGRSLETWEPAGAVTSREMHKAKTQIGTLGGGNHFIEMQAGDNGQFYVMIHSGSRNVGKQVADHYNDAAKLMNETWRSAVPREWDLAFLPLDSLDGLNYFAEMEACVAFAKLNRAAMLEAVLAGMESAWGSAHVLDTLDIAHNYAAMESHGGKNVMVHRKGATRAREGELGIIPGSQGTASYIVRGKGNPLSYQSCSHGAGRQMGRKDAERRLDLAEEQRKLDEAGVLHAVRGKGDLDEAPGAYKPIEQVMAAQTDLVDIVVKLRPLAVVKG